MKTHSTLISFVFCLWIIIDFLKIEKDIVFKAMFRQFIFCNGPTIWLLRGEGVWVISEKNIIQTDFEGEKFLVRRCPAKNIPALKKIPFMAYNAGKNVTPLHVRRKFYHQRFGVKKFLHKPNHPYPQQRPPPPPPPHPPPFPFKIQIV